MRAPQKTINSPESGRCGKYKYSAIKLFPIAYAIKPSAPPINTDGKIANPSNPSVRFTAFEDPTRTNVPIKINKNAVVGAGSVITQDVKENSLSIERSEQEEIENYKRKK